MLPQVRTRNDYRAIYADDAPWLPAMEAICGRHGLDPAGLRRLSLGTHVVFRNGDTVLKLFCSLWGQDYPAEKAALEHLGKLPVPELIATGVFEGWPYMLLTVMPGVPADKVWDELDGRGQRAIISHLGVLMAELHRRPPIRQLATDWSAFLKERIDNWREHHRAAEPWLSWLAQRLDHFNQPTFEPVLLHADIAADNLLLAESGGRWQISGFIDFGDAMMGHPTYDFIAPLTYFTLGQPQLSQLLLEAYGLELTPERSQEMTTYCFLHRFARLSDFQARVPLADGPAFERALWGDL